MEKSFSTSVHMSWLMDERKKFAGLLLKWYDKYRRDLPWRAKLGRARSPDPYAVWVSEIMLQQTRAATVVEYFQRFMKQFPTVQTLASAEEQEVLRLWQGLGYYTRARNLHAAAKRIVADFAGQVPENLEQLLSLPGIGRYTAGAIASIVSGIRAPVVDGNVARVLCRLLCISADPRSANISRNLWQHASDLLPDDRVGDFNSAMMELGAIVCTPRNSQCNSCPVKAFCRAKAQNRQHLIPLVREKKPTPLHRRWVFCLSWNGKWLIEQRPSTGRWPALWQFITIPAKRGNPTSRNVFKHLEIRARGLRHIGQIEHALSHRRYEFDVYVANIRSGSKHGTHRWVNMEDLNQFPMSRPQEKIAQYLLRGNLTARDGVPSLGNAEIAEE